jgi:hypothetical protein
MAPLFRAAVELPGARLRDVRTCVVLSLVPPRSFRVDRNEAGGGFLACFLFGVMIPVSSNQIADLLPPPCSGQATSPVKFGWCGSKQYTYEGRRHDEGSILRSGGRYRGTCPVTSGLICRAFGGPANASLAKGDPRMPRFGTAAVARAVRQTNKPGQQPGGQKPKPWSTKSATP